MKHLPAPRRVGHSLVMVVPEDHIRPAGEEDSHHAVEVVLAATEEERLEAGPILPAEAADRLVGDPILPAAVVEDPILLVEAADLLEGPSYLAVEGVEDPNCPVAGGAAGRSQGFVADNHLRTGVEGDRRTTCLALRVPSARLRG